MSKKNDVPTIIDLNDNRKKQEMFNPSREKLLTQEQEEIIRKTMMEREAREKKQVIKKSVLDTASLPPQANLIIIDNLFHYYFLFDIYRKQC